MKVPTTASTVVAAGMFSVTGSLLSSTANTEFLRAKTLSRVIFQPALTLSGSNCLSSQCQRWAKYDTWQFFGAQEWRIRSQWKQWTCSWEHTCSYHRQCCRRHCHWQKLHCCLDMGIWWYWSVEKKWRWSFFSLQIEDNRFFIHSTYVHFGGFPSLLPMWLHQTFSHTLDKWSPCPRGYGILCVLNIY